MSDAREHPWSRALRSIATRKTPLDGAARWDLNNAADFIEQLQQRVEGLEAEGLSYAMEIAALRFELEVTLEATPGTRGVDMSDVVHPITTEDVECLLERGARAGSVGFGRDRFTGVSSNALVEHAFTDAYIDVSRYPADISDMHSCERAYAKLPKARQARCLNLLLTFGAHVKDKYPHYEPLPTPPEAQP